MADRTIMERLQPSLLDRLTDLEPEAEAESQSSRVIDIRRLRDIIRRDLGWLLNANNQDTVIDAELYPNVINSVLNFGVRDVSGDFSTSKRAELMRDAIKKAVAQFEPRIKQGTLDVSIHTKEEASETLIEFDIHADMWAQPVPLELFLRSQIDLVTGHVQLEQKN